MHLTRAQTIRIMPISRKGTRYIARAKSHVHSAVPIVVALRDMLKVVHSMREAKLLVHEKLISVNGKQARDVLESLRLFNILGVKESLYRVNLLSSGRFHLEKTNDKKRLAKIVNKRLVKNGKIQLELHDGTNILEDKKANAKIGDSVELDFENKIIKVISIEKGSKVFIISGKNIGLHGKIENVKEDKVKVNLAHKDVELNKNQVVAL